MDEVINIIQYPDLYDLEELEKECDPVFFNKLKKEKLSKKSIPCPCTTKYCETFETESMGIGVRTKKFIPSGTKIGCYLGTLKNLNDKKRKDDWRYDFQYLFKKYYVDGSNKLSIMSYVNHSNDDNVNVLYELHSTNSGEECHIVYQTKNDIEMNEEVFIDYGNDYWNFYHKEKGNKKENKKQRLITDYFNQT